MSYMNSNQEALNVFRWQQPSQQESRVVETLVLSVNTTSLWNENVRSSKVNANWFWTQWILERFWLPRGKPHDMKFVMYEHQNSNQQPSLALSVMKLWVNCLQNWLAHASPQLNLIWILSAAKMQHKWILCTPTRKCAPQIHQFHQGSFHNSVIFSIYTVWSIFKVFRNTFQFTKKLAAQDILLKAFPECSPLSLHRSPMTNILEVKITTKNKKIIPKPKPKPKPNGTSGDLTITDEDQAHLPKHVQEPFRIPTQTKPDQRHQQMIQLAVQPRCFMLPFGNVRRMGVTSNEVSAYSPTWF